MSDGVSASPKKMRMAISGAIGCAVLAGAVVVFSKMPATKVNDVSFDSASVETASRGGDIANDAKSASTNTVKGSVLPVEQAWTLLANETLTTLAPTTGKQMKLSEKSEPVLVIVVWASWCEYCKEMLDVLARPGLINNSEQIRVVTLNVDETVQDAEGALRTQKWGDVLESVFDGGGKIREWVSHGKIPLTLIFDRERKVKGIFRGGGEQRAAAILGKARKEAEL